VKKCRICKESFQPFNSTAYACSPECALTAVKTSNAKKHAKAVREGQKREKQALRTRREALKTRGDHLKECQKVVNKYIRLRDQANNEPCISCQRHHSGKMNAGHFKAVGMGGGSPLRFQELNIHLQCEPCNSFLSGNVQHYRRNLIAKIGLPYVEWLEGPHKALKLSIEDIKQIKSLFRMKIKHLNA
jgi:hypothetical protein